MHFKFWSILTGTADKTYRFLPKLSLWLPSLGKPWAWRGPFVRSLGAGNYPPRALWRRPHRRWSDWPPSPRQPSPSDPLACPCHRRPEIRGKSIHVPVNINRTTVQSERGTYQDLSYIHLGSSVCHPVFHPVCHPLVVAILYVLVIKLTKETRRMVSRGRDYRWRDKRWGDWRGRVWIEFSLFKPNLRYM